MAKKVRRVKKKNAAAATAAAEAAEQAPTAETPKLTSDEIFQLEYAYVIKDLQRVLLVSGIMFVLLIVLNLLLQ